MGGGGRSGRAQAARPLRVQRLVSPWAGGSRPCALPSRPQSTQAQENMRWPENSDVGFRQTPSSYAGQAEQVPRILIIGNLIGYSLPSLNHH